MLRGLANEDHELPPPAKYFPVEYNPKTSPYASRSEYPLVSALASCTARPGNAPVEGTTLYAP